MALDEHAHAGALPCGTLLDELIEQVTEGRAALDAAHQASCRYCHEALAAIRAAWEEFLEFARSAVDVPGDLAQRITAQIQGLARAAQTGVVLASGRGQTLIGDEVLRRIARAEVLRFDDVALATVTVSADDARPGTPRLRLRVVARYGVALEELADAVRRSVATALVHQACVSDARVDVEVADIVLGDDSWA